MGNSLAVKWLEFCAITAEGLGSIPGQGTKIPQASWHGQKKQKKQVQRNKQILFKIKMLWYLTFYQSESRSVMPNSLWPHRLYSRWNSPDQNTGVGGLSLLQGIFPTQGLNPGHPYCRQNLYQLSHQGSPRILEWAVHPFQQIFPTQESKQGLLYCRQILYQLSYQVLMLLY